VGKQKAEDLVSHQNPDDFLGLNGLFFPWYWCSWWQE